MTEIDILVHIKYYEKLLKQLPEQVHSSYMTALFFIVSGYDILGQTSTLNKQEIIDWVYTQQNPHFPYAGFRPNPSTILNTTSIWDYSSSASTYSALGILKILGDDFARVDKDSIINTLIQQINADGSVNSHPGGIENDLRFVYCLCAVCELLGCWERVDKGLLVRFVRSCQTYEAAFGISPGLEAHGGATYCALSCLCLLGKIDEVDRRPELIQWLVMRQGKGFQGRVGKAQDSCYGYWIGLSLKVLGADKYLNTEENLQFYYECQSPYGGFSKYPGGHPDLTHSYLGLCSLSVLGFKGLKKIFAPLGLPID
jgi:geranylgeranyl transferase type-1 subunit beta